MERLWQDLRYAVRTLSKSPGFLVVALCSLALGIGANTAIFSLINTVMLRELPVADPERLVLLTDPAIGLIALETTEGGPRHLLSYPEFEQLRAHNGVFSGMFAAESVLSDLDVHTGRSAQEAAVKAHAQLVSGEFFEVLGLKPVAGRVFTPEEDKMPGANPVAVISYGFWQRQFGGDKTVVGQTIHVGRAAFRILGVAPAGFRGVLLGSDTDLWIPITMQAQALPGRDYLKPRDTLWLQVMGRLAPGMSRQTAEAGVNVAFQQILKGWAPAELTEKELREFLDQKIQLREGGKGASPMRDQFSDPLVLLMGMVGLVLLIACANIANLMLARASGRQREIGVRLALGAGRWRLIRQLLTESILVSVVGGILGGILAAWGTDLLLAVVAGSIDHVSADVPRDWRVFLFTAATSVLTGILFGVAPALRATRVDVNRTLAASARGSIGGRGRAKTGRVLVVAQVALSLLLLMGATLFVRSLHNMMAQKLGYDRDRLLMVTVDPVAGGYKGASVAALYQQVRERLRTIPSVRNATLSNARLFEGDARDVISLDSPTPRSEQPIRSNWSLVGPDYFSTVGIPLLRGREISANDDARQVCVINESFARFFFPNSDPIGKHVTDEYPTTRETYEIIGVVADARERRLAGPQERRFYPNIAHPIGTVESVTFMLNTSGDPANVISTVRRVLAQIDRNLPMLNARTVGEQIDRRLITQRLIAQLSAFFGGVALVLAAIGLYGVMSYSTSRRTGEIGVRVALGASQGHVSWMVLRETLWLVAIGVAIGLPCAVALGRLISASLFGLTPWDPATIALAITIILCSTMVAGYVPARRASHIDPMNALRYD